MDEIEELLTRGVENIIPDKEKLRALLASGKKLNIYLGIDPTATQIHVGHAVPLRKLNAFAQLGHNVTFLIGDFTALIGDTSDKDTERPVLTHEQIKANFETYKKQAEKILDFSKVTVRFNSEWLNKLDFAEIVKLSQHFSAGEFVSRELIRNRLDQKKKVGLHELLYPVMQGYDSYFMDTDIQLGGTDQTFNMQAGRVLQKDLRNKESFIIANGFLEGTDGRKMSKSWGNAIWLSDTPENMYGKVMSLKDDLIVNYFTLLTDTSYEAIASMKKSMAKGENPMNLKKRLAFELTKTFNTEVEAEKAQDAFKKAHQENIFPEEAEPSAPANSIKEFLIDKGYTSTEAKNLIAVGSVDINGITIKERNIEVNSGDEIRIGKKHF